MKEVSSGCGGALNQCHKLVPWKKVCQMEICVQETYGEMLSMITPVRERRQWDWTQRRLELSCNYNKGLSSPNGSAGAGMPFRVTRIEVSSLGLYASMLMSHWYRMTQRKGCR